MAIFRHESTDRLVWQPRLHHLYDVNKLGETLPEKYKDWDLLSIYDLEAHLLLITTLMIQ